VALCESRGEIIASVAVQPGGRPSDAGVGVEAGVSVGEAIGVEDGVGSGCVVTTGTGVKVGDGASPVVQPTVRATIASVVVSLESVVRIRVLREACDRETFGRLR
jgi:hypothetical protein